MALKKGIPSISHRSRAFQDIFAEAVNNLRILLNVPDNYHIVFTSSATEIWERITDNLIDSRSFHFVNGAFSEKFYRISQNLGKKAEASKSEWGLLPEMIIPDKSYDVIGITQNETSTGVQFPLDQVKTIRNQHPEAIIAIDAVSSLPVADIDYQLVDTVYFSVQKGFGLPAGLGVWMFNDRCLEKNNEMTRSRKVRKSTHNLVSLFEQSKKNQTPSTPNVLDIFLLSKVTADMLEKGIQSIRNESIYKATLMYQCLEQDERHLPFVQDDKVRSKTVIVATTNEHTNDLVTYLSDKNMIVGTGYGKKKDCQVRIANFPTHSKEQFEQLADIIDSW